MVLFINDSEGSVDRLVALATSVSYLFETATAFLSNLVKRSVKYFTTTCKAALNACFALAPYSK